MWTTFQTWSLMLEEQKVRNEVGWVSLKIVSRAKQTNE